MSEDDSQKEFDLMSDDFSLEGGKPAVSAKPEEKKQGMKAEEIEPEEDEGEEEELEEKHELAELPSKQQIKDTLIVKAKQAADEKGNDLEDFPEEAAEGAVKQELKFLEDADGAVFIGRKKSVFEKYGNEAGLFIGRVKDEGFPEKNVLLDGLTPHVVFVCGARGSGKCLAGDSLITLESGELVEIKDLAERKEKVLGLNGMLKVSSLEREGFFEREVDKIFKIRLRSGKEIKLTPEHPLLTVNGWKPADSLEKGSRIATPRTLPAFGELTMHECDVKLLAYLIAEGHLGNAFVLFSNSDAKIVEDFKKSINEFDENLRIEQHSHPYCFRVAQKKKKVDISHIDRNSLGRFTEKSFVISSKSSLREWLEEIGLYGKNSLQKFIPKEIMQLKKEQLALFLSRLFSCDGTIHRINRSKNWQAGYASSSEKLIRQVQHLLLRFGIVSKLRNKRVKFKGKYFDSFELVLTAENAIKFIEEIGFYGKKEEKQEIALHEMNALARNPNVDTVPKELWQQFKPHSWTAVGRTLGYSSPKSMKNAVEYSPSREKLLKIAQVEENIGMQILAESDIFWDEITSIEEINEKTMVYDISVPRHHNFVANDIIVHNSYVLGVMAEELATKNKNVATVVIDPIGVFWSMRYQNKEQKEIEALAAFDLEPQGLENLSVFIPKGIESQTPKETYDNTFSIRPNLLTAQDWALTFGIERFSPTGLLLEKAMVKVVQGFKTAEGKDVKGKENYSLEDLIFCMEQDSELNSREKGYKADSIRALVSRFEAAKSWGIFDEEGTPLAEICREGQLTVIDTSFLDDTVTSLVIGILARRILAARKISTRKEAARQFESAEVEQMLEIDIPPTWLFIDEAHTLIPSGNLKTPATDALVEYVKQGRRPGCSLVFATQQPSAIDTKVLSQLDIIIAHKLIFNDDIKAVFKRTPTIIPYKYKVGSFIKTLPIGTALTGDRAEETSRAFIMKIRPRMSQHEGREAETVERHTSLTDPQVLGIALAMAWRKLSRDKKMPVSKADEILQGLNSKYKAQAQLDKLLAMLEDKGAAIEYEMISLPEAVEKPSAEKETEIVPAQEIEKSKEEKTQILGQPAVKPAVEKIQLLAFNSMIGEKEAKELVNRERKKRLLGFLGEEEIIDDISFKHIPVYKVEFNYFNDKNTFRQGSLYVNSLTGEFLHFKGKEFIESSGMKKLYDLTEEEFTVLDYIARENAGVDFIVQRTGMPKTRIERYVQKFAEQGIVSRKEKGFSLSKGIEMPSTPLHPMLASLNELPVSENEAVMKIAERVSADDVSGLLRKLWKKMVVTKVKEVFWPVIEGKLRQPDGNTRKVLFDAITGKKMNEKELMD